MYAIGKTMIGRTNKFCCQGVVVSSDEKITVLKTEDGEEKEFDTQFEIFYDLSSSSKKK